jgi:hypothetical protein
MPRRRAVNLLKDLFGKNEFQMLKKPTAPAARRLSSLREFFSLSIICHTGGTSISNT